MFRKLLTLFKYSNSILKFKENLYIEISKLKMLNAGRIVETDSSF